MGSVRNYMRIKEMSEKVEPIDPVEPSNAATAVEAATAHTNGRNFTRVNNIRMRQEIGIELSPANQKFINGYNRLISTLPLKPTPSVIPHLNRPKISSSTPVILARRTGKSNNVSKMFEKGLFPPKSGGKRTKKRSKKAKKTRKH
jgi:hypothetical protein